MAMRVFPGPSSDIDHGYSSKDYRGGNMSSITMDEMESQRNRMTLEEARWIGVRKKVPGMSSIPAKQKLKQRARTRSGNVVFTDEDDPYQRKLNELTTFVRQHFRQKECACFIPDQKPGNDQFTGKNAVQKCIQLKCGCGDILMEHAGMQGPFTHFSSQDMMFEYIVPKELQHMMSPQRRHDPPPREKPKIKWTKDKIRDTATCAFGKINFENVEHAGGKKPAKYIRMADTDSVENLITLMVDHWKIMEPEKPNLVISVVGGAKNFKLDGRLRDTFSTGLIKAAKTTSAWLISSGFNMGVMKAVGQAVRQGQSFCWDNDRMVHVLRCIGIAPWGYVNRRRCLESLDGKGKFNANYRTSNVILHNSAVPLNPDHTHFIFVDDGHRIRYDGVAGVRAKLEQTISAPQNAGGLGIPVVLVVVEGGRDCITGAKTSLEHNIPVVVCAGTGRAADILAYAYTHTKITSSGASTMRDKHELKLMDKIYEAYGKSWPESEINAKTMAIKDDVMFCCQRLDLMTLFHMNKHEDLDLAILSVLLKAKKGADEEQRLSQLKLALTWDRVDIAQEEIFREDVLWSTGSLDEVLTEALISDKVKFVELILQQGVVMKEYLTMQVMEKLYDTVPKHNYLYKILHRLTSKETLSQENITAMLRALLDRYDTVEESLQDLMEETEVAQKDIKLRHFKRPYKMLLVWSILLNRPSLAKLFWELGEEPVTSALVASRIFHFMSKNLPRHESHLRDVFAKHENEFEKMATSVLDECHHKDPEKAMMIAERKSPCWNEMSCLQIAASAVDQEFLSSVTCQNSMNVIWKHGILFSLPKLFLCMLFPPYIAWGLEILNIGEGKLSFIQKVAIFYSSPLAKFAHGMVMYLAFLILHSYMVLVDFKKDTVTPIEIVIFIWVFSFFVDEIYMFIAFPSPTIRSKIRDWYGFLKWLDLINFILAFIAFFIHFDPQYYNVTKVLYCVNSIIFYLRIMKIYITNGQLGPKMFMILRMLDELRMFVMVMVVFLLAYGVASQGLLYHMRSPTWTILKDVIYYPYWQLYGEIFLEEIDTEDSCVAGSADCRTSHWLVPFLLAGYLLVGNILLLNLLIAIFSHVFDMVEKNSIEIWKYQMYFLVMEYEKKTAFVPPFSLLQHAFLIVQWIVKNTCMKHKHKGGQTMGRRHLEYLQLFEKEMMMNYRRQMKAQEMSGIEMTVNKLQKRVDELTKLIEDEMMDQQPDLGATLAGTTIMVPPTNTTLPQDARGAMGGFQPEWPSVSRVIESEKVPKVMFPFLGEAIPEEDEPPKKKKPKKNKKNKKERQLDDVEEPTNGSNSIPEGKISNNNLNITGEPEKPTVEKLFTRVSDKKFLGGKQDLELEDSGTDNVSTPTSRRRELAAPPPYPDQPPLSPRSPGSMGWSPKRVTHTLEAPKAHAPLKHRFSKEIKYVSSGSDSEEQLRRFSNLKKKKKKKKKSRSNVPMDSD